MRIYPVIISLFDYSGNWAKPYQINGYTIIQVDLKHGCNILNFDHEKAISIAFDGKGSITTDCGIVQPGRGFDVEYSASEKFVYGILAAPPCTVFSTVAASLWKKKDASGETQKYVELVEKTNEVISACKPSGFFCIENPKGRIQELCPSMRRYNKSIVQPFSFGHPYTKETHLYGKFTIPFKTEIVEPISSWITSKGGGKDRESATEKRSETPLLFAQAFYEANSI